MFHLVANIGTWGDDAYFYHFAPRYLELATLPGGRRMSMLSRMISVWDHSPQDCRAAVDVFMWEWWRHAASSSLDEDQFGARDLLEVIGDCDRRVDIYLAGWPAGVHADLQLAATVRDLYRSTESDDKFWRDVNAWLYGPVPLGRLTAALASAPTNGLGVDDVGLLTEAHDLHLGFLQWRSQQRVAAEPSTTAPET